jgi:glycosyltransferase involved in cell wall biosynthesis
LNSLSKFDISHQLTQITFREPGFIWKLGIPFVWGPTGGTGNLPMSFYQILSVRSRILEVIRTFSNYYQYHFSRRIKKAFKFASLIYTFSIEDSTRFAKRTNAKVKLMLDAGTYPGNKNFEENANTKGRLKAIWCGQLSERKAPEILIKALALDPITREQIDFKIIGDGPLRESLIQLTHSLQLKNIEWIKQISHDEVFTLMRQADFFIHTSLREATSNVIPEALSCGLPVICHDANGMSIAINESCGIKIPLLKPDESIKGFQKAIKSLVTDPILLRRLKQGAIKRSSEISWDTMAEEISQDYLKLYNK